ncbi:MarR family transcriptional regulator [Streptomyces sp. ISL-43]|uniref:MarR family winged helix-turn-helix transcriptional regulator n=1 Tax=Streptomyces sp. ISL-43 TaxID=2819183 RepID=UPI001BE6A7FD|nr:MarR family transcriptional regulator [Streptomyces sp. ISL-43]MBT2445536.1 MarR family transcriptional regulator [Streptomyces sp. ISL-43]
MPATATATPATVWATRPAGLFRLADLLAQAVEEHTRPVCRRYGLGRTGLRVLTELRYAGDPYTLAPSELSRALGITSGALTGCLDRLEEAALVTRLPVPGDRRRLAVRLTPEGVRTAGLVLADLDRVQREALSLSDPDTDLLIALLDTLTAALPNTGAPGCPTFRTWA